MKILLVILLQLFIVSCVTNVKTNIDNESISEFKTTFDLEYLEWIVLFNNDGINVGRLIDYLESKRQEIEDKDYYYIKSYLYNSIFDKKAAIEALEIAFEKGHVDAGYRLYTIFIRINKEKALKFLNEAALRGSISAQFTAGTSSIGSNQNHFSKEFGLEILRKSAMKGDVQAIGRMADGDLYKMEMIEKSEYEFWRMANLLINKDESPKSVETFFNNIENLKLYCSLFNEFKDKNFEYIYDSANHPDNQRLVFWGESFLKCN